MSLTKSDLARISRVLQKEEALQPIEGSVTLIGGVLTLVFNGLLSDALDAQRALMAHHLNTDIDPNSDEARARMIEGGAVLELDVLEPLWRHSEIVPPSEIVEL